MVRMMHTLLGKDNFRKGMDLYFERHDGQAVTTDDFRSAMQYASGIDLDQFQRWYEQSGTPSIDIERHYDAASKKLKLVVRQDAGFTKDKANKPFHLPMRLALFNQDGEAITLDANDSLELAIDIKQSEQTLEFDNVADNPLISAFRGFSAPVNLTTDLDERELALLMTCDTDPFNQWEASQQYATRVMLAMIESEPDSWPSQLVALVQAYGKILNSNDIDLALMAEMMVLPGEKYLSEMLDSVDPHKVRDVREAVKLAIANAQEEILRQLYGNFNHVGEYGVSTDEIAERRLKNTCLSYLLLLDKPAYFGLCLAQFKAANNMTDQMAGLLPIVHFRNNIRDQIVADFYEQWQDTALVVDKWFSAQGASYAENSLQSIVSLFEHEAYILTNPNRARSFLGALIGNSSAFHQADGEGYHFVADRIIELDAINPQVAARMANTFVHWKRLIPAQGDLMKTQIERMLAGDLSNDLSELLTTSLQA